jgi:Tol biopolymer transport system component
MTPNESLERRLASGLPDLVGTRDPDYLPEILVRTERTRQRPDWIFPERWLPVAITMRLALIPRAVILWMLLSILVAGAIAGAAIGARLGLLTAIEHGPVASTQNGLIAFDTPGGDIVVADPDGGHARVLVSGDAEQYGPSWSPDGTRLAYFEKVAPGSVWGAKFHVHVVGADGSGAVDLTPDRDLVPTRFVREQPVTGGLEWSPDSRSIALSVMAPDPWTSAWGGSVEPCGNISDPKPSEEAHPRIVVIAADGSGIEPLQFFQECWHKYAIPIPAWDPVWSPDGSELAFKSRGLDEAAGLGIFISRFPEDLTTPADPRRVTSTAHPVAEGFSFDSPSWSPDGSRITFYCCEGEPHDIWVVNADGSDERAISTDPKDEYWPTWSPDGSRIAYQRQSTPPGNDLMLIDPDGGEPTRLDIPPSGGNGPIAWSPDGTKLLLITDDYVDFILIDVEAETEPVLVTDTDRARPEADLSGDWQPLTISEEPEPDPDALTAADGLVAFNVDETSGWLARTEALPCKSLRPSGAERSRRAGHPTVPASPTGALRVR